MAVAKQGGEAKQPRLWCCHVLGLDVSTTAAGVSRARLASWFYSLSPPGPAAAPGSEGPGWRGSARVDFPTVGSPGRLLGLGEMEVLERTHRHPPHPRVPATPRALQLPT